MSDWITEYAEKEWQTAAFTNAKDLEVCLRWFASRANKETDGDGDTWKAACKRLEGELEQTRSDLEVIRGVPCYCGPDGEPGPPDLGAYLDAVKERDEERTDNEKLRCLLREAVDKYSDRYQHAIIYKHECERITAALEGKP
jgi:hypothetical protein